MGYSNSMFFYLGLAYDMILLAYALVYLFPEDNKKRNQIYVLKLSVIFCILSFSTELLIFRNFKIFGQYLTYIPIAILTCAFILKNNLLIKSIFAVNYSAIASLTVIFSRKIAMYILDILGIDGNLYLLYFLILITGKLSLTLLALTIQSMLKKHLSYFKSDNLPIIFSVSMFSIPIFGIILSIFILKLLPGDSLSYIRNLLALSFIVIDIFFIYMLTEMLLEYSKKEKLKHLKYHTEAQARYLHDITETYEKLMTIKHEMVNSALRISSLLKQNQLEDLKTYVDNYLGDVTDSSDIQYTGSISLDSLLHYKITAAKDNGVNVHLNIDYINNKKINEMDLITLLANLIDNAIEAAINSKVPEIFIEIKSHKLFIYLCIKNSVKENVIELNPSLKSTKENSYEHGFGMRIIKNTIRKYQGRIETTSTDHEFTQSVYLMYPI